MSEVFGQWVMCSDDLAHYRINGKFLCKSVSRESGKPIPVRRDNGIPNSGICCSQCRRLNTVRWINHKPLKG